MSRHKYSHSVPKLNSNTVPGIRVQWQDRHGKHVGVLANPADEGAFYAVIEDGKTKRILVRTLQRENVRL